MCKSMTKDQFETKLKEVYNGAVTPLTAYVNERAVMVYKCNDCGVSFFGKAGHMLGKKHQQHLCNMPYGNKNGERTIHVSSIKKHKKKDNKQAVNVAVQLEEMIWNDFSYKEIAQVLQVNPVIIKDYFENEGLI